MESQSTSADAALDTASSSSTTSPMKTVRFNNKLRLRPDDDRVAALRKCSTCAKAYRYQSSLKRHLARGKCGKQATSPQTVRANGPKSKKPKMTTATRKQQRQRQKAACSGSRVERLKREAALDGQFDELPPSSQNIDRRPVEPRHSWDVVDDVVDDDGGDDATQSDDHYCDGVTVDFDTDADNGSPVANSAAASTTDPQRRQQQLIDNAVKSKRTLRRSDASAVLPLEQQHRLDEWQQRLFDDAPSQPTSSDSSGTASSIASRRAPTRACLSYERLAREFLTSYGEQPSTGDGGDTALVTALVEACHRTVNADGGARALAALATDCSGGNWCTHGYGSTALHLVAVAEKMLAGWLTTEVDQTLITDRDLGPLRLPVDPTGHAVGCGGPDISPTRHRQSGRGRTDDQLLPDAHRSAAKASGRLVHLPANLL